MLTLVICCLSDIYHIGRELLFIIRRGHSQFSMSMFSAGVSMAAKTWIPTRWPENGRRVPLFFYRFSIIIKVR